MAASYLYNAYGQLLTTAPSISNPFQYGGKFGYYTDDNPMGVILAQQRWYSPHIMRWLSRDPIEYDGGDNLYGYVLGNPVGLYDDTGESPAAVAGVIVTGAGVVGGYVLCKLAGYCGYDDQISIDPNGSLIPPVINLDPEAIGAPNGVSPAGDWSNNWCEDGAESEEDRDNQTVGERLKEKRGRVKNVNLPKGSPSIDDIRDMTIGEVKQRAKRNEPGFKTIKKILTEDRGKFNK